MSTAARCAPPFEARSRARAQLRSAAVLLAACLGAAACTGEPDGTAPLDSEPGADSAWLDLDAPALAEALGSGRLSAERLTRAALARIAAFDDAGPELNAIIEINPDAIEIARELDRRFAEEGPVGPLHGLPVVLKANIDTADRMATSAGSIALANHHAAADAEVVGRLRAAGAVILAKANLSEWANFRSLQSTSGWSSLGGQTKNPYVLDRNPCGSSSGSAVAVAARLAPLAVGTETDGSIVCPAGVNGIVGIKPTVGLVSAEGIIPIAASQDTAGPFARTVRGAAMLLAAMRGPASSADSRAAPATTLAADPRAEPADSAAAADLAGVRLGVVRDYDGAGADASVEAAFERWLAMLRGAGAELVDPIELRLPSEFRAAELEVLLHEFKAGIDRYLAAVEDGPRSLDALIAFNEEHAAEVMPFFGQDVFLMAQARGGLDAPVYREALQASGDLLRDRLERLFGTRELDALVAPANAPAWTTDHARGDVIALSSSSTAAVSGYPSVVVPAGFADGLPVGMAFIGEPYREERLIEIAAVFEGLRAPMPAPAFLPTLGSEAPPSADR